MFEFFVKHAVCNRSVWVFANKRRVNTVSSNSVFDLNIAVSRPSVLTFCRADLLCLCWDGLQRSRKSDPDKHLGVVDCGQQSGKSEPIHENEKADEETSHVTNNVTGSN